MIVPFGAFQPDIYDLNASVASEARGVLPGANSYVPWPQMAAGSLALADKCHGAVLVRAPSGTFMVFAGTKTKLYKFAGATTAWTDVSGAAYSVDDDARWSFALFGKYLVAVNINDAPQFIDVDAGVVFADLGGSPPKAHYAKTVGDFVVLSAIEDMPDTIQWCGRNAVDVWTPGTQDADYQQFSDGGSVAGVTNLETGLVFQGEAIRRFAPVSTRAIFQFARIESAQGSISPASIIEVKGTAFYLSENGFAAIGADNVSIPIGIDAVTNWFLDDVNTNAIPMVCGAIDPARPRIFWAYSTGSNSDVDHDSIICFDIALKRWTYARVDLQFIMPAAVPGTTLEALDSLGYTLDTLPFSLDSSLWSGGLPLLASFTSDNKLGFFAGSPMAAVLETAEFQPIPGRRSFVRGFRPATDAASLTCQVGVRENLNAARNWSGASALNSFGTTPLRASGRYARGRLSIDAGETWTHAQGLEPDIVQAGQR